MQPKKTKTKNKTNQTTIICRLGCRALAPSFADPSSHRTVFAALPYEPLPPCFAVVRHWVSTERAAASLPKWEECSIGMCAVELVSMNAVSRASSGFCLAAEVAGWRNGCSVSGINDYIREWVRRGGLERDFYAWIGRPFSLFFPLFPVRANFRARACHLTCLAGTGKVCRRHGFFWCRLPRKGRPTQVCCVAVLVMFLRLEGGSRHPPVGSRPALNLLGALYCSCLATVGGLSLAI